jgi:hypothetical protein
MHSRIRGDEIDPDKMILARDSGATPWDLPKRAWKGEFAVAQPLTQVSYCDVQRPNSEGLQVFAGQWSDPFCLDVAMAAKTFDTNLRTVT